MQPRRWLAGAAVRVLPDRIVRVLRAALTEWRKPARHSAFASRTNPPTALLPISVFDKIKEQGDIEPAVLAPGVNAIRSLRQIGATDLAARNGIDARAVLSWLDERPIALILMPMLCVGGAEKYAADIAGALSADDPGRVLVIVTDQSASSACGWERYAILRPFQRCKILFWSDISNGPGAHSPVLMALFLNALRPSMIFVVNSRIGLEATAHFGRGLSQHSRLFCAFFGLGKDALGAPYGVRFARATRAYATLLTDNSVTAGMFRQRYGAAPGPGIAVLPASLQPCMAPLFALRVTARLDRVRRPDSTRRWVWVSRIEPWKGTAVLAEIAKLRPNDQFDLFGPLQEPLRKQGLRLPNVFHRGILDDISVADFSAYDGFLFTSLFEGMPNVVLEITQHALPLILADVGGLRDTLSDRSAIYVQHAEDEHIMAKAFATALTSLLSRNDQDIREMVMSAKREADARHSPSIYRQRFDDLAGVPGERAREKENSVA
jgi:glycosyltransferase involved in cell wall biosynthesis